MMEMEGRGNVKCQKSKSEDIIDIIEFDLMIIGQNKEQLSSSFISKEKKRYKGKEEKIK